MQQPSPTTLQKKIGKWTVSPLLFSLSVFKVGDGCDTTCVEAKQKDGAIREDGHVVEEKRAFRFIGIILNEFGFDSIMATDLLAKIICMSIYTLYTLASVSTFSILFFKYICFGTDKENSLSNQSFFG